MVLPDYYELVEPLVLPIRGKKYTIQPIAADDMIRWKIYAPRLRAKEDIPAAEKITDAEFFRMFLGPALDEMLADGVLKEVILHAAHTALSDAENGREVAERVWSQADPKALTEAPKPNAKASTPSPSTGAATSTKPRARTTGTKRRPK